MVYLYGAHLCIYSRLDCYLRRHSQKITVVMAAEQLSIRRVIFRVEVRSENTLSRQVSEFRGALIESCDGI